MAVTKLWSVTERLGQVIDYATNPEKTSANIKREFSPEQYQALADVIAYAKDEEKTEREFYVEGINCNVAIARDQFITVKEQYQKTDGIQRLELSDEVIMKLNDQLNMIRDNIGTEQEISITYFVPDDKKSGGAYLTHSGIVKKIDEFERKLIMQDETVIPTEQISVIQGEMFKGLYE